jgi:hypothetical protein
MHVREYLKRKKLSQKYFAEEKLKISLAAFRNYLNGKRSWPLKVALLVIEVTHGLVSIDDLKK